jgi:hypothetical protein
MSNGLISINTILNNLIFIGLILYNLILNYYAHPKYLNLLLSKKIKTFLCIYKKYY